MMNIAPCSSPLLGWSWGWTDVGSKSSNPRGSRGSVCGGEGHLSINTGHRSSSSCSSTRAGSISSTTSSRLHPQQYLHVGGRPCARRSSAPLLPSSTIDSHHPSPGSSSPDLRVPFADALGPHTYDPYGPYSVYGLYTSSTSLGGSPKISPRGSPRASPRISPRSSPRRQSRVMSRDLCLDDLVVVSVPCRERKVEGVRLVERGGGGSNHYSTSYSNTGGGSSGRSKPSAGVLYLTATHLIFVNSDAKKETWILHMHISSVEKLPLSTQGSPLHIRCKTFLSVTFIIPKERDCHEIYTALLQLSQPATLDDLFCFHYTSSSVASNNSGNNSSKSPGTGWELYKPAAEYDRMGVSNSAWCPTSMNSNYEICDTYPQELYVPSSAPSKVILGSSKFRSKGRFPVLTYLHKNKASLTRCSQPLSGFKARCLEDEQMLEAIRKANPRAGHMTVVDTRPKINAIANRATGKGYENEAFYEHIKFHFAAIDNIHVMRSSLAKLVETCQIVGPSMSAWLSGVEGSNWLRHVRCVLESGSLVARELAAGVSVLVHCSDGWDRTAQTCALAQLMLDQYYRTIQGFQVLLEKEWLSFGHKFTDRCGLIQGEAKEVSPVFTQFLECVWQLQQLYPTAFEFNERYLLVLHDHVHSAQFGTFVGNCQKDRVDLRLSQRTVSLWSYLSSQVIEHTNPLYRPLHTPILLQSSLPPQALQFWRGLYCRYWSGVHPREPLCDLLSATQDHCTALQAHANFCSKRIAWLTAELAKQKSTKEDPCNNTKTTQQLDNRLTTELYPQSDPLGAFNMEAVKGSVPPLNNDEDESEGNNPPVLIETSPDKQHTAISPPPSLPAPSTLFNDNSTTTLPCTPDHKWRGPLTPLLAAVAVDWQSLRNVQECSCSTPFQASSRKHHCWMCGEVFCTRCIDKRATLPGHTDMSPAPVCRPCYKTITRSLSVDTP